MSDRVLTRAYGVLLVAVALIHFEVLRNAYRAPKLWLFELGTLVLLGLAVARWRPPNVCSLRGTRSALRLWVPLLLVVALTLPFSAAVHDSVRALWSLTLAGALLVVGCRGAVDFRRLLGLSLWVGLGVGLWALYDFFQLAGSLTETGRGRLGIQASLGNPSDLALFLVPICLVGQARFRQAWEDGDSRWLPGVAALVCGAAVLASTTMSPIVALLAASPAVWWPRRLRWPYLLAGVSGLVVVVILLLGSPAGERARSKMRQMRDGDVNQVLTGRLDGWWVAFEQFRRSPATGTGFGTFGRQFNSTKEQLIDHGAQFYEGHGRRSSFANAHNEFLELAAGGGVPALLVALWWLIELLRLLRRRPLAERRLAWALWMAASISALFYFPFRLAATGLIWLLVLGWWLQGAAEYSTRGSDEEEQQPSSGAAPARRPIQMVAWVVLLAATLWNARWVMAEWAAERSLWIAEVQADRVASMETADQRRLWRHNLDSLENAARARPHDARLPMAIGTYWFLAEEPERSAEWYRRSLALEVRPETLVNLARAQRMLGDEEEARAAERRASKLDPFWRRRTASNG